MKIKTFLKYISYVLFTYFSTVALADIDVRAYKGIQEKINEDYQHLNPLWGQLLLDSGIIYNMRFYGDFIRAEQDGTRLYAKDSSKDDVWNLLMIFFPSVTGSVGTTTSADTNFARYVTSPFTIALLLKHANDVRALQRPYDKAKIQPLADKIIDSLDIPIKKKKDVKKRTIEPLINYVSQSVLSESEGGFYPRYFTESIILAFFVKKFNNQMDIWSLLNSINRIFDKAIASNILEEQNLLTMEDVNDIANRINEKEFNAENAFNMLNADIFSIDLPITPYREGKPLIENETICAFMRKTEIIDPRLQFADCAETALRHVLNLLLYSPLSKSFDLSRFDLMKEEKSAAFKHLKQFYEIQTPNRANDSSTDIRIAWNKVVADLNIEPDKIKVKYVKNYDNEIETGFINFVRTLQKIFNIELDEQPQESYLWVPWLEKALETVFRFINPFYQYNFSLHIKPQKEDILGKITVTVKEGNNSKLSFAIEQSQWHAKITDLTILDKSAMQFNERLRDYNDKVKQSPILASLAAYQQSLSVIAGLLPTAQPYVTFPWMLDTNNARLSWLDRVAKKTIVIGKSIYLDHVLKAMSWDDFEILRRLTPITMNLVDQFKNVVTERTEALFLQNARWLKVKEIPLTDFRNLGKIVLAGNIHIEETEQWPSGLKTIQFLHATIGKLSLKNLNELKIIDFEQSILSELILKDLGALESLSFRSSSIKEHLYLENLPQMKIMSGLQTSILDELNIEIKNLPSLSYLDLGATHLSELSISNLLQLESINLINSSVTHLKLKDLRQIRSLHLEWIKGLSELSLNNLAQLETINLKRLRLKKLEIDNLPSLTKLDFEDTDIAELITQDERLKALIEIEIGKQKKAQ